MDNNNTGNQTETTVYGVWVLRAYDSGIGSGIKITSQLSIPDHPVAKPELEHQLAPKYPQRAGGSPGGFKDTNATHRASKKQTCIQKRATYGLRRSVCSKVGAFDSERLETLRWSPWAPQSGGGVQRHTICPKGRHNAWKLLGVRQLQRIRHPATTPTPSTNWSSKDIMFKTRCAQRIRVQKTMRSRTCNKRTPRSKDLVQNPMRPENTTND